MHIPNLHWIVADDNDGCNTFLDFTLNRFGKNRVTGSTDFLFMRPSISINFRYSLHSH